MGVHEPIATPRIAAGLVILSEQSVLMARPNYKDYWDIPGGYVQPGESPEAACRREVHEELGLAVERLLLAAVDWAPNSAEGDKMLFLFSSSELDGLDPASLTFPDGELTEARYVGLGELDQFTIPRLVRRLTATAEAVLTGRSPVYLEQGQFTPGGTSADIDSLA
jgi:ADP-ribose pyrophosphatase YjhB (NUDIX family)